MQGLQAAMSQLKSSSEKLVNSKLALASLQQAAEGTRMLVPITSSLYVPGETTQLDNVLIDVGTGYYIEKSVRCAPRSERGAARETLTMRARGRRR